MCKVVIVMTSLVYRASTGTFTFIRVWRPSVTSLKGGAKWFKAIWQAFGAKGERAVVQGCRQLGIYCVEQWLLRHCLSTLETKRCRRSRNFRFRAKSDKLQNRLLVVCGLCVRAWLYQIIKRWAHLQEERLRQLEHRRGHIICRNEKSVKSAQHGPSLVLEVTGPSAARVRFNSTRWNWVSAG